MVLKLVRKGKFLPEVRLHLTNVTGAGASELLTSLLPALLRCGEARISKIYLPESGKLSHFSTPNFGPTLQQYSRFLPNSLSRFFECTFLACLFDGKLPLLVLGDLPLRIKTSQTVFVQNAHLIKANEWTWSVQGFKNFVYKFIFFINLNRINAVIVQTKLMHEALILTYPSLVGRIFVIPHPVPDWLIGSTLRSNSLPSLQGRGLRLIYPAAKYPHKNHALLGGVIKSEADSWPVDSLTLTIEKKFHPAPDVSWIHCVGFLSPSEMIERYGEVDALLFLSNKESFGFPLLEAMYLGLPIVCPNLRYAREFCGDQAIYFDPNNLESLRLALEHLRTLLIGGWWPDWSACLKDIPESWNVVASKMLQLTLNSDLFVHSYSKK